MIQMGWRLEIRFRNNSGAKYYLSGDVRFSNPGWGDERFSSSIEHLKFHLPTGHSIVLSGMEAYNFFVEASCSLGGAERIDGFWICGKKPGSEEVELWGVSQGRVTRQLSTYGHEWRGGPVAGWRKGLASHNPVSTIIKEG